jgi:hypothetical protein
MFPLKIDNGSSQRSVPASSAVPAAAKQQHKKYNDEKCGGIHASSSAYCVLRSLEFQLFDNA